MTAVKPTRFERELDAKVCALREEVAELREQLNRAK
jgi:uncharacterized protein YceH (UPF0502 family)